MEAIGEDASIRLDQTRPVENVRNGYSFFENGDVAFAKVTPCFENGKATVMAGLDGGAGFGTTEITVARPNKKINNRFLFYVLTDDIFRQQGKSSMTGAGGLKRVPDLFTKDYSFIMPPLEEQHQIVEFLDQETTQIDDLIRKQECLIELLAEKRQAVITQAVIKGLDPDAPTKSSGIPWVGDIPKHWNCSPLKWLAKLTTGITPSTANDDNFPDEQTAYPWVRPEDLNESGFPTIASKYLSLDAWNSCRPVVAGSVLICCIGATLGKAGIVDSPTVTNQQITSIESNFEGKYLFSLIGVARQEIEAMSVGNTLPIINTSRLGMLALPIPPNIEQVQIANYIDSRSAQIDQLTSKSQKAVSLLHERRSALISAAVAGRLEYDLD